MFDFSFYYQDGWQKEVHYKDEALPVPDYRIIVGDIMDELKLKMMKVIVKARR